MKISSLPKATIIDVDADIIRRIYDVFHQNGISPEYSGNTVHDIPNYINAGVASLIFGFLWKTGYCLNFQLYRCVIGPRLKDDELKNRHVMIFNLCQQSCGEFETDPKLDVVHDNHWSLKDSGFAYIGTGDIVRIRSYPRHVGTIFILEDAYMKDKDDSIQ